MNYFQYFSFGLLILYHLQQLTFAYDLFNKNFSVANAHSLIKQGWNCSDIVKYFQRRSYEYNSKINAIISYNPNAMAEAIELDKYYAEKKQLIGRLHCIPLLVKDLVDVKGIPTTAGLKALRYSIPNKNADIIDKLKAEGAIVLAKANMAKLAVGMFYASDTGGECKNPFDLSKTCGASSSGSGAGMAASMAIIAIGSDTDGSILYPAAWCGIFALRPAQDEISLTGVVPAFLRQDVVGPMSKNMNDLVLAYSIMVGNTSIYDNYISSNQASRPRVGYITNFYNAFNVSLLIGDFTYDLSYDVETTLNNTISNLKTLNMDVIGETLTDTEFNNVINLLKQIVQTRFINLQSACYRESLMAYFNDSNRFESDSPYHSFDDFLNSKLLSEDIFMFLNDSNMNNSNQVCSSLLVTYENYKKQFSDAVKTWFDRNNLDPILFGTTPGVAEELYASSSLFGSDIFSSSSGLAALNIPASYSRASATSPQGLPIGLMLLSKRDTLGNTFRIAKMLERGFINVLLPHTTPILDEKCASLPISSGSYIEKSYYIILLSVFTYFHLSY